jgi:hypothetical protein
MLTRFRYRKAHGSATICHCVCKRVGKRVGEAEASIASR